MGRAGARGRGDVHRMDDERDVAPSGVSRPAGRQGPAWSHTRAHAVTSGEVEIEGRRLKLSNLDKLLYPEAGFSKAEVIDYYVRVAPVALPHLRDRPLTLKRYPDGVEGHFFYEKSCPSHRPDWVRTARIRTTGSSRWGESGRKAKAAGSIDYCVVDDLPTLVWVANLASLELHTPMHISADSTVPRMMVFDL